MDLEKLKNTYKQNKVAQAICDHLAGRDYQQRETKLERVARRLASEGFDFKKSEYIDAFRGLQDSGCGQLVEGRHGWPTRFVWTVNSRHVAGAARGQGGLEEEMSSEHDSGEELIEHSFVLRPDVIVSLELPSDLSKSEAARLAAFIQALPFD